MLLVQTYLAPSPTHGIGCFAAAPIAKGQLVWVYDPRIDLRLSLEMVEQLPSSAREMVHWYGYLTAYGGEHAFILCGDNARHINHAATPNLLDVIDERGEINLAARDIAVGEELTCDYFAFDLAARDKLS